MAPTNDERREVAAAMRAISSSGVDNVTLGEILNSIISGGSPRPTTEMAMLSRLADLIGPQERTCHPKGDWKPVSQTQKVRRLVCDCGYEFGVDRENAAPFDISIMCELPNFCPNCGARVVSSDDKEMER